jgi:hypothetical protein
VTEITIQFPSRGLFPFFKKNQVNSFHFILPQLLFQSKISYEISHIKKETPEMLLFYQFLDRQENFCLSCLLPHVLLYFSIEYDVDFKGTEKKKVIFQHD